MSAKPRIEASRIRHEANLLAMLPADAVVRKCGNNHWRTRCPLHQGEGFTFAVWYGGQGWQFTCFACGEKGSVIDFAMKSERLSFKEALAKLSTGTLDAVPVALWAAPAPKKEFVIPCIEKGCAARVYVDLGDVPFLGRGLHNAWTFTGTLGNPIATCPRCLRQRLVGTVGRMNTSGTEAGAGNAPAAGCREAGTGLADSPKTPRRPNA